MATDSPRISDGWNLAVSLTATWLDEQSRPDQMLETRASGVDAAARAVAQSRLFAVVRHWRRIDETLQTFLTKTPRSGLLAILAVAAGELIEETAAAPEAIVHHAVERAKKRLSEGEARLVNAVLRKTVPVLRGVPAPAADAPAAELGRFFSHPDWLVEKWLGAFGPAATRQLLEWNLTPAAVHVRWRSATTPPPACLEPTPWPKFFRLASGRWAELMPAISAGLCYLQDPATRFAAELAALLPGEDVLDLCAAPGGKTFQLADALGASGRVVAVDRGGIRFKRLEENAGRWRTTSTGAQLHLMASDVLQLTAEKFGARHLPVAFDAVVLDAPCSNTGVIRHRIDAKWRIEPGEFEHMAGIQAPLLARAAEFVRPGGRLVYSTCSLEVEENERVVAQFTASPAGAGFKLERSVLARPWEHGHDGAGIFLLRRGNG